MKHTARRGTLLVVVLATALRIVDARQLLDLGTHQQHIDQQQVRKTKEALAAGGNAMFHSPAVVPGIPDQTVGVAHLPSGESCLTASREASQESCP